MTSSEKRGRQSLLLSDCFSKSPVSSIFCFYLVKEVVFLQTCFQIRTLGSKSIGGGDDANFAQITLGTTGGD